jgi:hypothetical protein
MKKKFILALTTAATMLLCNTGRTQVLLTDIGTTPPTPGTNDVYLLDENITAQGEVPGLNYYSNGGNSGNPGEIFTTGSSPTGYLLTSVTVLAGGSGGDSITTTAQKWDLRLYSISASSNATLLATYASQPFTFFEGDWLQFTNLGAGLQPNTTYAYTVQNTVAGWELIGGENEATVNPNVYATPALIPSGGGQLGAANYPSASGWQADFDVGLAVISSLTLNAPVLVTPGNVYPTPENAYGQGTVVTIASGAVLGAGPIFYQWRTDGGSGGALTNIPGQTSTNIVINTPNLGVFQYDVVVHNASQSVTSSVVSVTVAYPTASAVLSDEGTNYTGSTFYPTISQLSGGGTNTSLNYYDNNPAHAGQTFATGTNGQGYVLTSVQIESDPLSNQAGLGTGQPYYLYIYSVNTNTSTAQILQVYTNASFTLTLGDWFDWSGLNVTLAPNSVYAWSFSDNNAGSYFGLASSLTNNYAGGQLCLITPSDGAITYDTTDSITNDSSVFYLILQAIGHPVPQPQPTAISISPSSGSIGTLFTLSETASGATPLTYFWSTDAGSGGGLTNIPAQAASNLVLNTVGWQAGFYKYQVIISNSYGTATSGVVTLPVFPPIAVQTTGTLSDIGLSQPTPGPNDIYQTNEFTGSGGPAGLNYYFDNVNPPGDTFTTGTNGAGYVLNSVAIELAGDDAYVTPDFPVGGQGYVVRIYQVYNDSTGLYGNLYASYASQTNFVISRGLAVGAAPENDKDWLQMSGLSLPLQLMKRSKVCV